jgi:endo-1,4-beta-xylanase
MKWQLVEPRRGDFSYAAADSLVQFAIVNNQRVRGHTLVWHNQLPTWLTQGNFSDAELTDILHAHVIDEVSHFRGQIYAWDVVNEPFNDDGTWRDSLWFRAIGPDYIARALTWAHEADPDARLYINDYNVESINPKSDALYALARDLLVRGVPLHGIGIQSHLALQNPFPTTLEQNLRRFGDLGLDVAVTEADVRMALPVTPVKLAAQADYYSRTLSACLAVEACVSYTVWGFSDAHSWIPSWFNGQGAATLFDEQLRPKLAYSALVELLSRGAEVEK